MNEYSGNASSPVYDRALLLHGSKRNEVLTLAEIEQYGLDSFADADYISIYGMSPREWYRRGIRLLGRTAVECTRDALGNRIGLDVASVATRMPSNQLVVIDPFAGSCNTLFWILRHLPNSEVIAFESDPKVFEHTYRNLATLGQKIELVHGDFARLLGQRRLPEDRGIVAFVAPPWGTALDELEGLDLCRTAPPINEVIEQIARQFSRHNLLFATQVYEKISAPSLTQIQTQLDWTELRVYHINEKGRNHGVLLGTKAWAPR
jgi:predicted RNA methylase